MTTEMTTEEPRKRRWISRLFKITFIITALTLVGLTVLANMGGSSDVLKQAIEEFVAESSPYTAHVGKLNKMTFFPNITFDFEDTEFFDKETTEPVMYLSHAHVVFGFWDVMARTGKIKVFNIEGLRASGGILLSQPLVVEKVAIMETETTPRLQGQGSIGDDPFSFSFGMQTQGTGYGKKFSFGPEREADISLGNIKLTGLVRQVEEGEIIAENIMINVDGKKALSGNLDFKRGPAGLKIDGLLSAGDNNSSLRPDIAVHREPQKISGIVKSDAFHIADFQEGSAYDAVSAKLESLFGVVQAPELKFEAANIYKSAAPQGPYNGPLPFKGLRFNAEILPK